MPGKENDSAGGEKASSPHKRRISRSEWSEVLSRVRSEQKEDNLSVVAAGVAFYFMLAIFPGLAAAVSIYGILSDPLEVRSHLESLQALLPSEAFTLIDRQAEAIVNQPQEALSFGMVGGLLFTFWIAARGIKALIMALNIIYDKTERRGFLKLNAMALLFTLGAIVLFLVSMTVIVAVPALLKELLIPESLQVLIVAVRWLLLAGVVVLTLCVLYRFAPNRTSPSWLWVSRGAAAATLLWLMVSGLFSLYVSNFGRYNELYGSMGAVIVLMMWFWLTAYTVLLGGELNAEMENQADREGSRSAKRKEE